MNWPVITKPSPRYLVKSITILIICGIALFAFTELLFRLIGIGSVIGQIRGSTYFAEILLIVAASLTAAILLVVLYYRSLRYEIQQDEVIVHVGVLTHSVKHVPYRTVTNITINRGLFDRWFFDLGTLNIQTAGMSGTTGAEESLVGLAEVQDIYDLVVDELHKFRGGMSPTAAGEQPERALLQPNSSDLALDVNQILFELRALREALENTNPIDGVLPS